MFWPTCLALIAVILSPVIKISLKALLSDEPFDYKLSFKGVYLWDINTIPKYVITYILRSYAAIPSALFNVRNFEF